MSNTPQFAFSFDTLLDDIAEHGYSIIENALPEQLISDLNKQCEVQSEQFQYAKIGRHQDLQQASTIRSDKTKWFDGTTKAEQDYLALMEEIRTAINQSFFLGLFDYECHFAIYQQGDFYKKHLDAFRGKSNRVFTTVCYLNTPEEGGELLIYPEKGKTPLVKVSPTAGTLICFESERFPHEVLAAASTRYSIAGWFRKNNSSASFVDPSQ
ncbi:2OG-Fe(II) oxygenase [Pseudoalteromonas sp. G4]|uniref:2OG-Fe(II) oxygenase n=1 Tax=Pseudoalteromonas sp. G4 TaxID=2992761 RepID=UPI00237E0F5C|nr:2OG-Fe(II) oxygenase [Pseudoalteromonas sp. G4]MDE3272952.1 2OG-Fe(II) oxygenase [Pseudoalteromonas sp. G4]